MYIYIYIYVYICVYIYIYIYICLMDLEEGFHLQPCLTSLLLLLFLVHLCLLNAQLHVFLMQIPKKCIAWLLHDVLQEVAQHLASFLLTWGIGKGFVAFSLARGGNSYGAIYIHYIHTYIHYKHYKHYIHTYIHTYIHA